MIRINLLKEESKVRAFDFDRVAEWIKLIFYIACILFVMLVVLETLVGHSL